MRQDNLHWWVLQSRKAVAVDYLVRASGSSGVLLVAGGAEVRLSGTGSESEAWAAGKEPVHNDVQVYLGGAGLMARSEPGQELEGGQEGSLEGSVRGESED